MRISDWSSDVCSSDLMLLLAASASFGLDVIPNNYLTFFTYPLLPLHDALFDYQLYFPPASQLPPPSVEDHNTSLSLNPETIDEDEGTNNFADGEGTEQEECSRRSNRTRQGRMGRAPCRERVSKYVKI